MNIIGNRDGQTDSGHGAMLGLILMCLVTCNLLNAQDLEKVASTYFAGVKKVTDAHQDIWNRNIVGPMILVEPASRRVYASEQDEENILTLTGDVFIGTLPGHINIAGAPVEWNGKIWAMLPFPFPKETTLDDGVGYLVHELFHRAQKDLGFVFPNEVINEHLEKREGRILLKLELQALHEAMAGINEDSVKKHLTNSLTFRVYRHQLYPGANLSENLLELNEGIAEYTTLIFKSRPKQIEVNYLVEMTNLFLSAPTYIRSFAYHTIPVYGYILQERNKYWNQEITMGTNLTDYFRQEFDIHLPSNLEKAVKMIEENYDGKSIRAIETERELLLLEERRNLVQKFTDGSQLEIEVKRINMSFDPTNVSLLDDLGTVYKGNVRFSDAWGILEVSSALLVSTDRRRIIVSSPDSTYVNGAEGNGWKLHLNDGYSLKLLPGTARYTIIKRD
jgi:hypothetical protein